MVALRVVTGMLFAAAGGSSRLEAVVAPSCDGVPPAERRDCAYPGIHPADCLARGCCVDTNASSNATAQTPSCFFGATADIHAEFLPRWHYIPRPFNWMNDPDGPFYDPVHKKYHLFVQYETPRQWAHAVSDDMIPLAAAPAGFAVRRLVRRGRCILRQHHCARRRSPDARDQLLSVVQHDAGAGLAVQPLRP